jgi:hypothetical protein
MGRGRIKSQLSVDLRNGRPAVNAETGNCYPLHMHNYRACSSRITIRPKRDKARGVLPLEILQVLNTQVVKMPLLASFLLYSD